MHSHLVFIFTSLHPISFTVHVNMSEVGCFKPGCRWPSFLLPQCRRRSSAILDGIWKNNSLRALRLVCTGHVGPGVIRCAAPTCGATDQRRQKKRSTGQDNVKTGENEYCMILNDSQRNDGWLDSVLVLTCSVFEAGSPFVFASSLRGRSIRD